MSHPASVLVVSEDRAAQGHQVVVELARAIFRLVDDECHVELLRFEPPAAEMRRKGLIEGNAWKSTRPQDYPKRRELMGYIATKLLEGDESFVLYHIDGDQPWSRKEQSENVRKFLDFIARDVKSMVNHRRARKGLDPIEELEQRQLLLMTPFYSIESWLYQNTKRAIELCRDKYGGQDVSRFEMWRDAPDTLDEEWSPPVKKQVCLEDRHNLDLATSGFPARAVYHLGKSFTETVARFRANDGLRRALAETRHE